MRVPGRVGREVCADGGDECRPAEVGTDEAQQVDLAGCEKPILAGTVGVERLRRIVHLAAVDLDEQPSTVAQPPTEVGARHEPPGGVEDPDLQVIGWDAAVDASQPRLGLERRLRPAVDQLPPPIDRSRTAASAKLRPDGRETVIVDQSAVHHVVQDGDGPHPVELGQCLDERVIEAGDRTPRYPNGGEVVEVAHTDAVARSERTPCRERHLRLDLHRQTGDAVQGQRALTYGYRLGPVGKQPQPRRAPSPVVDGLPLLCDVDKLDHPGCDTSPSARRHQTGT
ncbi:MAG TPA: hypothetical protein VNR62_13270 [Cellulomonas sp.]|nr:hypothetical protein [Cellulomonas sp.]